MINDRISDTITRIRNASIIESKFVLIPYTKLNFQILKVLLENNYIISIEKILFQKKLFFIVYLKYNNDFLKKNRLIIHGLKRISKPSLRIYIKHKALKKNLKNKMIIILSTSEGLMSSVIAYKKKLGGEPLFYIW